MIKRNAQAIWEGTLKDGHGNLKTGSDRCKESYTFASRFENADGTNPEELLGAAHAGCYSMALSEVLADAGHEPKRVDTRAAVELEAGDNPRISKIELTTEATVPGMNEDEFKKHAEAARKNCIISQALGSTEIGLTAKLNRE